MPYLHQYNTMLKEQIAEVNNHFATALPEDILSTMQAASEELRRTSLVANATKVGEQFPHASLINSEGGDVDLHALLGGKPAIITFYRGTWCPYCNLELRAYEELLQQDENKGITLIAISPEKPDVTTDKLRVEELPFHVLSDADNKLASALGITFHLPMNLHQLYLGLGIDVVASQGNDKLVLPVPATYIVDAQGVIKQAWIDTDYTVRAEPAEVVEHIKQLGSISAPKACGCAS